jgi:hypothetical protein
MGKRGALGNVWIGGIGAVIEGNLKFYWLMLGGESIINREWHYQKLST